MPKTKNGGFILDDSGLAPYSVQKKQEVSNTRKATKPRNIKSEKRKGK